MSGLRHLLLLLVCCLCLQGQGYNVPGKPHAVAGCAGITYVDVDVTAGSDSGATLTFSTPTVQNDDIILVHLWMGNDGGNWAEKTTTDFTEFYDLNSTTGDDRRTALWYRIADGTEGSSYEFDSGRTLQPLSGIMHVFRCVDTTNSFDIAWDESGSCVAGEDDDTCEISYNNPTTTIDSATTVTDNAMIVTAHGVSQDACTINAPSGYTQVTALSAADRNFGVHYKLQASEGATGDITHTPSGCNSAAEGTATIVVLRESGAVP